MTPINPHVVEATLAALPAAIAVSRKLLRQNNETTQAQFPPDSDHINQIHQRANGLTETLKNIVGYPRHGLNE